MAGLTPQDIAQLLKNAQALAAAGRAAEAEEALKDIVKKDPSCGMALYRLGIFSAKRDDTDQAADYFTRALAVAPDAPEVLLSLAAIRLDEGDRAAAYDFAQKAERLTRSPLTLHRLGGIYRQAGEMDLAREAFEKVLQQKPDYIAAYYGLGTAGKFAAGDAHFERLKKFHGESSRFSAEDRALMGFTLGRGCLAQGDEKSAFAYLAEANQLKKSLSGPFDAARFNAYIDSVIKLFDEKTVAALKGAGDPSDRPVFIIGMPRSGSTLVEQILSSHPSVTGIGESAFFQRCIPYFPNAEFAGLFVKNQPSVNRLFMDNLSSATLAGIGKKYIGLTQKAAQGASRVVDKMLFNYLWAGLIRLALPNAKIIHCTRDPRDIALSLWQLTFPAGMQWTYDLRDMAQYYLAYKRLMAHWDKVFKDDIHEVNYETVVENQEAETRRLLAFCNLPWDDRCLRFHETTRMVKTASAAQVRQPVYKGSVGKWKQYENYLAPLIDALAE